MSLGVFQPLCVLVLAVALWAMSRTTPGRTLVRDYLALAVAAWIGEESCIRVYRFYGYASGWALRLDEVPLLVPLIWPIVILSARQVGHALGVRRAWMPAWVLMQVTVDASLVEIIAVRAGFWTWTEPGYLEVPLIGILGWGFFAAAAVWALERGSALLALVAGPVFTHLALLASWWGLFRWVWRASLGNEAQLALVALSAAATIFAWKRKQRVPLAVMMPRMIAAALFVGVLVRLPPSLTPFLTHTLAVAAPYLALTRFGSARQVEIGGQAGS